MAEQGTDTTTGMVGTEQDDAAQAAATAVATQDGTATGVEAGEQTVAAAKAAEEAARQAAENPEDEVRKLSPKAQEHINKKIGKLSKETKAERELRHAAELKAARLEGENETLKRLGTKPGDGQSDPNQPPARPKVEDFESVADFNAALLDYTDKVIDWKAKQIQAESDKKIEEVRKTTTTPETSEQKQVRQIKEENTTILEKIRKEFGDEAAEVIGAPPGQTDFWCTSIMRTAILEKGENAVKIFGVFAKQPELSQAIAKMSPAQQVREIDKLEQSIITKRTTQAPAPVTTVGGKGAPGNVDESKMSDEEWGARRAKQKLSSA